MPGASAAGQAEPPTPPDAPDAVVAALAAAQAEPSRVPITPATKKTIEALSDDLPQTPNIDAIYRFPNLEADVSCFVDYRFPLVFILLVG